MFLWVISPFIDFVQLEEKSGKFSAGVSAIVRISLKDGTHHEVCETQGNNPAIQQLHKTLH